MSETTRIMLSVFGSALTIAVALAALILTSADHTRRQFNEQIELTRGQFSDQIEITRQQFSDQIELTRQQFAEQNEAMHRHFSEQIELTRRHSDSQFEQVREDLREVRGEVRSLAERVAKVEGLLVAARTPEPAAPSEPPGAGGS